MNTFIHSIEHHLKDIQAVEIPVILQSNRLEKVKMGQVPPNHLWSTYKDSQELKVWFAKLKFPEKKLPK